MCGMTLRLDPRRPILWRTPHSLQVGADPVLAHLDEVSDGDARLVDALAVGVTRSGLAMLADHAGVAARRVDALLEALAPALEPPRPPSGAAPSTIAVVGRGVGAQRIAGILQEAGSAVVLAGPGEVVVGQRGRRPALAVLVSTHVIDPLEHQRWLRADVAHLPVVFGEAAATIGPRVEPGATACLGCVERARALDEPLRAAIAAQLQGRAAAAESASLATEAAVEALRMLRASIPNRTDLPVASTSVRLDADSGARTTTAWWPDSACGCRGLTTRSEPVSRRENGSPPVQPAPRSSAEPTTARARVALG